MNIDADSDFLASKGIMDYSLLLVIECVKCNKKNKVFALNDTNYDDIIIDNAIENSLEVSGSDGIRFNSINGDDTLTPRKL